MKIPDKTEDHPQLEAYLQREEETNQRRQQILAENAFGRCFINLTTVAAEAQGIPSLSELEFKVLSAFTLFQQLSCQLVDDFCRSDPLVHLSCGHRIHRYEAHDRYGGREHFDFQSRSWTTTLGKPCHECYTPVTDYRLHRERLTSGMKPPFTIPVGKGGRLELLRNRLKTDRYFDGSLLYSVELKCYDLESAIVSVAIYQTPQGTKVKVEFNDNLVRRSTEARFKALFKANYRQSPERIAALYRYLDDTQSLPDHYRPVLEAICLEGDWIKAVELDSQIPIPDLSPQRAIASKNPLSYPGEPSELSLVDRDWNVRQPMHRGSILARNIIFSAPNPGLISQLTILGDKSGSIRLMIRHQAANQDALARYLRQNGVSEMLTGSSFFVENREVPRMWKIIREHNTMPTEYVGYFSHIINRGSWKGVADYEPTINWEKPDAGPRSV